MAKTPVSALPEFRKQFGYLMHSLGNSLDRIAQASCMLAQVSVEESTKVWLQLIEESNRDAMSVARELRSLMRTAATP